MTTDARSRTWLWVLIGGGAFFIFLISVFTLVYLAARNNQQTEFSGFGSKIAVIDLEGVIIEPRTIVKDLKRYAKDDSVKAIILHINTPGGGAAASQEIYDEVKRIRTEKKKPIISSIETLGASGGFYVAVATNKIYANPASIVGSIGVITQWYNYGEFLRWLKIKDVTIKAGELKDAGNPAREMTPAERQYIQSLIDDMHVQFIKAVAEGRNMKDDDVKPLADGRVWTGSQALSLKMIDQVGDFETALRETAKSVGISGEPTVVRPEKERRTMLDLIFGDISDLIPTRAKLMENHMGFYYLWK
ncbi:MAG: signal peptide peptidase SppA [Acidobacteriales bacterium]|nr:signal peptide peptidase SppA [Terriglobales bacterium]